jgi:hypothetical protein
MFAKKYLGINDAIKILEEQGITVRLFDLQDLAREGVITPLIYVDADFVNSTYPTGVEVEPKRINERHCFTRFNGYVICKNANLLDAYLGLNEVKAPYFGELFLGDTELMFEVVDCLYAKSDMVSNGKTGYLFYPFNNATGVRHTSLQTFHIKNVRLYRSDVEVIANLAAKSVDKQKIIDDLTSQLVIKQAQLNELNKQSNTRVDDEKPVSDKMASSYLLTIAILLELLQRPHGVDSKTKKPYPPLYASEAAIIGDIEGYNIKGYGQGETSLNERFKAAKVVLGQTKRKVGLP